SYKKGGPHHRENTEAIHEKPGSEDHIYNMTQLRSWGQGTSYLERLQVGQIRRCVSSSTKAAAAN
ncbi:unnamed protein product, partial [marine sediment metagenome]